MVRSAAHPQPDLILHASCAAVDGRAVLLRGQSGSGKSSITLELLSRGAELVSDDRTCLRSTPDGVLAYAPAPLLGAVEARFVGLLAANPCAPALVHLVVDLDHTETQRLPPRRSCDLLGRDIPLFHKSETPHFAAAILQYLKGGPWTDT